MPTFANPAALLNLAGQQLGSTDWMTITQERINVFADATDDHQWIHVDVEKAKDGPFGAPIAHGFLTLSMANRFLPELLVVAECSMGINYGCNKVRFPSPVVVGSKIRGHGEVVEVAEVRGGVQIVVRISIEIEGVAKPGCVVDTVSRFLD